MERSRGAYGNRRARGSRRSLSLERTPPLPPIHEPGVRVFKEQPVRAACRCSTGRIQDILRRFSADERKDMTGDDGMIGVTCEFCSVHRVFDPKELEG